MASGATGGVENRAGEQLVEQLSNHRLLDRDRVVAGLVVVFCPLGITRIHIDLGQVTPLRIGRLVQPREDLPDFRCARFDAVEGPPRPGAQQRQALDAEDVVALSKLSCHRPSRQLSPARLARRACRSR